ncbi:MAG: transporter, partial [Pseudomonadota bacterium]
MFIRIVVFFTMLFWSELAFGGHPLITDDTGTQGRGKFQLELNGKYDYDDKDGVKEKTTEMATSLTYGIIDEMDIV